MVERGRLIAFEGIEGAGKSTHIGAVAAALRARGVPVMETHEPGGTVLGVELRRLLMHRPQTPPTPLAELLLYLADRAQHVAQLITPAMARGEIVLTDRFSASTIAYQGYGRGLDLGVVTRLDAVARQGVSPALTVLLDCPVEIGLRRARGDDRFHREERQFHERVRAGFLSLAREDWDRYCVIDAAAPPERVQRQILAAVSQCLHLS
ncbi:MAG: dTMP kinase [Candidatus Binatia bacterium]